jgi:hypothetical protein
MRDQEDRRLHLARQLHEEVLHGVARSRIERAERLVHQEHARLENERARERHALPHPARQLLRILAGVTIDVEAHLSDPLAREVATIVSRHPTSALQTEGDVVLDRPIVERRVVLEHEAAIRARRFHGLAQDFDDA